MNNILKNSKTFKKYPNDNSYTNNVSENDSFDIICGNMDRISYEIIYDIIIDCVDDKCNEQDIIQQIVENNGKHKINVKNIKRCYVDDCKLTKRNYIITIIIHEHINEKIFINIINTCTKYNYFIILALKQISSMSVIHPLSKSNIQKNKISKIKNIDDTVKNKKIQNNNLMEINNINLNNIDLNDVKLKEENNNIIKLQEQNISISSLKQNIKNLNEHYNQFLKINETVTNDIKILEEYLTKNIYI